MTLRQAGKRVLAGAARRLVKRRPRFEPAQWQLDTAGDGSLHCDGVPLAALAREHGTPLHVLRVGRLRAAAQGFLCGGGHVYFSVKTNPTPGLLRLLFDQGIGAEVVSRDEYALVRRLGMPPERILVNGAARDLAWLDQVIADGVALLNLNGGEDMAAVRARSRVAGIKPRVGLRVSAGGWSGQFGEPESRALPLLRELAASEDVRWCALHFHHGPLLRDATAVDGFLAQALGFCDRLQRATGLSPAVLDLGGSLACPTVDWLTARDLKWNLSLGLDLPPPDAAAALSPGAFVQHCEASVARHFGTRGLAVPQVWLEPGRALVADTQLTLAGVRTMRDLPDRHVVGLDAGVNVLAPVPREYHEVFAVGRPTSARATPTMLIGPLFHPGDVLAQRVMLPRLDRGDVLAIMDTGAYCQASSTQFSFLRPAVVAIDDGRARLLQSAETLDDLLACDERAAAVERSAVVHQQAGHRHPGLA